MKDGLPKINNDLALAHSIQLEKLQRRIAKLEKDNARIKEVIDTFHGTCEYSQFEG